MRGTSKHIMFKKGGNKSRHNRIEPKFQNVIKDENKGLNNEEDDFLTRLEVEAAVTSNNKTDENSNSEINNVNDSRVFHSGNSDVNIKIYVDLLPLAFTNLYSLYATKQISSEELELALSKLKDFLKNSLND